MEFTKDLTDRTDEKKINELQIERYNQIVNIKKYNFPRIRNFTK